MGPKTAELIATLDRLEVLLAGKEEVRWAALVGKANRRLKNSDFSGIGAFLSLFGGMGSFGDRAVTDNPEYDQSLEELKNRAFKLAREIQSDHEISGT